MLDTKSSNRFNRIFNENLKMVYEVTNDYRHYDENDEYG